MIEFINWLNQIDRNVIDLFLLGKVIVFGTLFFLIVAYMISCATSKMPDNKE